MKEKQEEKQKEVHFSIKKGKPYPLGVHLESNYVYFSVSFPNASECKLKLYNKEEGNLVETIAMSKYGKIGDIFYLSIEKFFYSKYNYMYEVNGKEYVDPYARVVVGKEIWGKPIVGKQNSLVKGSFEFNNFSWEGDQVLHIPYEELILYRLHVRGFTNDSSSKVKHKGTYQGIIEKIPYLKELGINGIEVLPAYEFDEIILEQNYRTAILEEDMKHKINYWGYSEQAYYFSPKTSYAANTHQASIEYKNLVLELHKAGIEVIMEFYFKPGTNQQLIMDCLRYWVQEYHIDGFKVNQNAISSTLLATDPLLSKTKLLGLSWNTEEIYGNEFTPNYKNLAEYNDGYQVDVRRFLKGDEEQVSKVAYRFKRNQSKQGIINYITNTNGFTLMDLYSYDVKHNEANCEKGIDGTDYNYSWNCGVEGPTRRKKIMELRKKQIKNAFVMLLMSQGVPLILSGDEYGQTAEGNNNTYCQDSKMSWLDWKLVEKNKEILEFVKQLIHIRKSHPILHLPMELRGMDYASCGSPDISYHGMKAWYPDYSNYSRILGIMLCGQYAMLDRKSHDDSFYFAYNMHWEDHEFDLPKPVAGHKWSILIDTGREEVNNLNNQKKYAVKARSVVVFIGKRELKLNKKK